jgi:methionine-rich copper-binding protein CopC
MRRRLLVVMTALAWTSSAGAHAFLERASPPVGGEIGPPRQIVLTFTEGVEPAFSSIEVHDARGTVVPTARPRTSPGNDRQLLVDLPALSEGVYTVIWHATSVDTHKTEGSYQFTVR